MQLDGRGIFLMFYSFPVDVSAEVCGENWQMQIVTNTLGWYWWLLILQAQFFYLSSEELLNCEGQTFDGADLLLRSMNSPFSMERRGLENTLLVMRRGTYCWEVIRSGEGSLLSEKRRTIEHLLLECWKPDQWCILWINLHGREDFNTYLAC